MVKHINIWVDNFINDVERRTEQGYDEFESEVTTYLIFRCYKSILMLTETDFEELDRYITAKHGAEYLADMKELLL